MGQVESCCGTREVFGSSVTSIPISSSRPCPCPVAALGNEYVTFQPDNSETFLLAPDAWRNRSFEIRDSTKKPWFRLEAKDDQLSRKRLVLNTGIQHGCVEQKGSMWHMYVEKERRATITKEMPTKAKKAQKTPKYLIYLHHSPYPEQSAGNEYGLLEPALAVSGDTAGYNYCFEDCSSVEGRPVARVERVQSTNEIGVQVAAKVDAALIVIAAIAIEAYELEDRDDSSEVESLSSIVGSTKPEDRDWKSPPKPPPTVQSKSPTPSKVPPLWRKGTTPRNPAVS